jgi:hypothetical protein
LGELYRDGKGVPQDRNKAFTLYQKAVEQGDSHALAQLGVLYENGWGVAQDEHKAVELYKKAMEHGDALGRVRLRLMREAGKEAAKFKGFPCNQFRVERKRNFSRVSGVSYEIKIYGPGGSKIEKVLLEGQDVSITFQTDYGGMTYTNLSNLRRFPNEMIIIQDGGDMCRFTENKSFR